MLLLLLHEKYPMSEKFRPARDQLSLHAQKSGFVLYEWPHDMAAPSPGTPFPIGIGPDGEGETIAVQAFDYGETDTGERVVIVRSLLGAGTELAAEIAKFMKSSGFLRSDVRPR